MPALLTPVHRRRLARRAALFGLLACAMPAQALADTLVVDDDGADCPGAGYTSLVAAVGSAAQGDTINVCAGTYLTPGGAASQGLRIEKNLTIRGQGADVVTIKPDPAGGPTIAAVTPNERDDTGNIITVKKRTTELENFSISGVTIGDPNGVTAEAGLAIIDVNQSDVHDVRVLGSVPITGPGTGGFAGAMAASGHGIVLANPEASSPLVPEENLATIEDTSISGFNKAGIVVDERRLAGTSPVGSNITATVTRTKITGFGPTSTVPQNGIEVWGGPTSVLPGTATLKLTDSAITGIGNAAPAEGANAAVFLKGASPATRIGPGNKFGGNSYGVYNGLFGAGDAAFMVDATGNWWGNAGGASHLLPVTLGDAVSTAVNADSFLTVSPFTLSVPGPGENAPPVVQFDAPLKSIVVDPGTVVDLAAIASDDFAVDQVEFFAGGVSLGASTAAPYEATFTAPGPGTVTEIKAVATDSGGLTSSKTITVTVPATPPPPPAPPAPPAPTPPVVIPPPLAKFAAPVEAPIRKGFPRVRLSILDTSGMVDVSFTVKRKVKGKTVTITVGTASGLFTKGIPRTLTVKLTKTGRILFGKKTRLATTAVIKTTTGGKTRTQSVAYTLRK